MKNSIKEKRERLKRRIVRVRAKIVGSKDRPRFMVFRSLKHIYASLIDDKQGYTLASVSDLQVKKLKKKKSKKTEIAYEVGKAIAEKAKTLNIHSVVFDRRGRKYHGRLKAIVVGAREGGLIV